MLKKRKRKDEEELLAELAELQAQTAVRLSAMLKKAPSHSFESLESIETRMKQRKIASHPAVAHVDNDKSIDVTIVDLSIDGIKVSLAEHDYLPEVTIFECDPLGGFIVGEVRWQDGREAGLKIDRAWTKKLRLAAATKDAA